MVRYITAMNIQVYPAISTPAVQAQRLETGSCWLLTAKLGLEAQPRGKKETVRHTQRY